MSDKADASIISEVAGYYSNKLTRFGETPQGVDWNGEESQTLRFQQLCKIIAPGAPFSINDVGSGYGALFGFLAAQHQDFSYTGIDIASNMVEAGQRRTAGDTRARFVCASEPDQVADYSVASGVLNVRQQRSDAEWMAYLGSVLEVLSSSSSLGFAFNCLTSYSDREKMRDYLFYADPCQLFDLCKKRYARNVALLHDYNLYEFTILVRKSA